MIRLFDFSSGEGPLATRLVRHDLKDDDRKVGKLCNMLRSGKRLPRHNRISALLDE